MFKCRQPFLTQDPVIYEDLKDYARPCVASYANVAKTNTIASKNTVRNSQRISRRRIFDIRASFRDR